MWQSVSVLCALTDDLAPPALLAAYRAGFFPMPLGRASPSDARLRLLGAPPIEDDQIGWFSPDPRGVLPLDGLRVSRSLRRSLRRYVVTVDTAFETVMRRCGDPSRPHGWINDEFVEAYCRLHAIGNAHSFETWTPDARNLVGGLYGVSIGGFFAGESMFSVERDASKVALVALVEAMRSGGGVLLDVQWVTPHLASLGAVEIPRTRYLELLADAVARPQLGGAFGN